MNCLRCGVAVEEGHCFCAKCAESFADEPVDKNAVVFLPNRAELEARRMQNKKRTKTTEEILKSTREQLYKCKLIIFVLLLVIALLAGVCTFLLLREDKPVLGQNYTKVSTVPAVTTLPLED